MLQAAVLIRQMPCMSVFDRSSLACAAENFDFVLDHVNDALCAGSEELTRVIALALDILACLDVSSGLLCESELALSVDVDLGDAASDGILDHSIRNTGAAVQNQRHIADFSLDIIENVEAKSRPSFGIFAVDVADACCQHCDAEISDGLALFGICALAHTYNAVFLAADGADLSFDGHALLIADGNELFGLLDVLIERKRGT